MNRRLVLAAFALLLWGPLALAQTRPAPAPAPASNQLELNSASRDALMTLDGIGEVRADAIIRARPFKAKTELVERRLITEAMYEKISDKVFARPPCRCSSAMVSPVSVFGASNHTTRPRSIFSPLSGSSIVRNARRRGSGRAGLRAERPCSKALRSVRKISASAARGPLRRMTESAPGRAREGVGVPSA